MKLHRDICSLCCCLLSLHLFTNTVYPLFSLMNIMLSTATLNYLTVRYGYCGDGLPHLNEGPIKVTAGDKWNYCLLETGSQVWLTDWQSQEMLQSNVSKIVKCSASVCRGLWALRHSPTQCLSTPEGRAGSSLPTAWISLPGYSNDIVPQLESHCTPC